MEQTDALLLDALAHELRSPLTVISGSAETLLSSTASRLSDSDRQSLLTRMAASAERMQALVANLADIRRESTGSLAVRRQPTDMARLVQQVLDGVDLGSHPIEVQFDEPSAHVDPFLAERIVENLVNNAVRHTPPGTPLHIGTSTAPNGVEIVVADEGPGIPADQQTVIFDRFRRGADATPGGLGLGLFLVRRFAELHGGQVWVDSRSGCTSFHVILATSRDDAVDVRRTRASRRRARTAPSVREVEASNLVPVGLLIADQYGRAIAANQVWEKLSGLSRADSLGDGWLDAFDPGDQPRIVGVLARVAESGADLDGPASIDCQLVSQSRRPWTRWWVRPMSDTEDARVVMAVADVHADHEREAVLRHAATHDPLTGLYNRTQFFEFAEQALRRLDRESAEVGVAFVDIDHFKMVNDSGGHRLGDRILAAVADKLRSAARPTDVIARVGGDEFAVLFEQLDQGARAHVVAARIREHLRDGIEIDGTVWPVSATVGVATTPTSHDSAEALLDRADQAMYDAKRVASY